MKKKNMFQKVKKIGCGLTVGLLLCIGVLVAYIAAQIVILPDESDITAVLHALYAEDQAVRYAGISSPLDIVRFVGGDWLRVNKVRRIVAADLLSSAEDYANAARILQHGTTSEDYLTAQTLSLQAFELGAETMLRHSALAEDRYLVSIGKPQKYGTQFACTPPDGWQLSSVDVTVTDAQRAEVDVEPLAEMEAKIAELNESTQGECSLTLETMQHVEAIMMGAP